MEVQFINSSQQFSCRQQHLAASELLLGFTVGTPPELHNAPEVYFVCQYAGTLCEWCSHYMKLALFNSYTQTQAHSLYAQLSYICILHTVYIWSDFLFILIRIFFQQYIFIYSSLSFIHVAQNTKSCVYVCMCNSKIMLSRFIYSITLDL